MYLSRIYLPSISFVLEAERHSFIPQPSSVIIPVENLQSSNSYPAPPIDSNLMKPVNLGHEELEGDEHFSFVVQFPEGVEVREEYDEVGQIVPPLKRPTTSRGVPSRDTKSFVPKCTNREPKSQGISAWRRTLRKVYPALLPTNLQRKSRSALAQ